MVSVCLGLRRFLGWDVLSVKREKISDNLELVVHLGVISDCNLEDEMAGVQNAPSLWLNDLA